MYKKSTAVIGMRSRIGLGRTRHIQVWWLWIQDGFRDKVVRLKKVDCLENEAHWASWTPTDLPAHVAHVAWPDAFWV